MRGSGCGVTSNVASQFTRAIGQLTGAQKREDAD